MKYKVIDDFKFEGDKFYTIEIPVDKQIPKSEDVISLVFPKWNNSFINRKVVKAGRFTKPMSEPIPSTNVWVKVYDEE